MTQLQYHAIMQDNASDFSTRRYVDPLLHASFQKCYVFKNFFFFFFFYIYITAVLNRSTLRLVAKSNTLMTMYFYKCGMVGPDLFSVRMPIKGRRKYINCTGFLLVDSSPVFATLKLKCMQ